MQITMKEYFQGRDVQAVLVKSNKPVSVLEPNHDYEVDKVLGEWLVKHGKAIAKVGNIHDVEPQFENATPPPHYTEPEIVTLDIPNVQKPHRGKRGAK